MRQRQASRDSVHAPAGARRQGEESEFGDADVLMLTRNGTGNNAFPSFSSDGSEVGGSYCLSSPLSFLVAVCIPDDLFAHPWPLMSRIVAAGDGRKPAGMLFAGACKLCDSTSAPAGAEH